MMQISAKKKTCVRVVCGKKRANYDKPKLPKLHITQIKQINYTQVVTALCQCFQTVPLSQNGTP